MPRVLRRLMRTLRRPDLLTDLAWRPFLLNPDMPGAGLPRSDYVVRKFGGEERAKRLYTSITEIGRAEGLLRAGSPHLDAGFVARQQDHRKAPHQDAGSLVQCGSTVCRRIERGHIFSRTCNRQTVVR